MAIKPLEKSHNALYFRIGLVVLLLIGALVFNKFFVHKKDDQEEVLGTEIYQEFEPESRQSRSDDLIKEIENQTASIGDGALKKTEEVSEGIVEKITNVVADTASKSAQKLTDFVYDNTVGNLIKQVDKLPEDQKEDIKRNICD